MAEGDRALVRVTAGDSACSSFELELSQFAVFA